jgi:putative NADH-flavin reductase
VPVIVVGADTGVGREIVEGLVGPGREVRAFVTDPSVAAELRGAGVKVALGDVSDPSHVEAASMHCFTAVLVTEAAGDGRERAFAETVDQVIVGWVTAMTSAKVTRVIWVGDDEGLPAPTAESTRVSPSHPRLVEEIVALDNARTLT